MLTHPLSVLVVEDDAQVRKTISGVLSEAGFKLATAATGWTALKIIESKPIDLVVADVALPGGFSGVELMQCARLTRPPAHLRMDRRDHRRHRSRRFCRQAVLPERTDRLRLGATVARHSEAASGLGATAGRTHPGGRQGRFAQTADPQPQAPAFACPSRGSAANARPSGRPVGLRSLDF